MREEGLLQYGDSDSTDEELRRFDRQRGNKEKQFSNYEWISATDSSSRIVKIKDGSTHLGYKAEHVADLESEVILSATVDSAADGDAANLLESELAQTHLNQCRCSSEAEEIAAYNGFHSDETLESSEELDIWTHIPDPKSRYPRRWTEKRLSTNKPL
jgi:transposase